jgi:hypothetical protein
MPVYQGWNLFRWRIARTIPIEFGCVVYACSRRGKFLSTAKERATSRSLKSRAFRVQPRLSLARTKAFSRTCRVYATQPKR